MKTPSRSGQITVALAASLPVVLCVIGLVIDCIKLLQERNTSQHACDAAAATAAYVLSRGGTMEEAQSAVVDMVGTKNAMTVSSLGIAMPPTEGRFAGRSHYVQVRLERDVATNLIHVFNGKASNRVRVSSVAGFESSPQIPVAVVLWESPPQLSIAGIITGIPALPTLLAGLELSVSAMLQ